MNSTTILSIIQVLINVSFVSIILFMGWKIYSNIMRMKYVKSFVEYISVLDYSMNKAYDIIYKDRVLVYSLDAQRVRDEDFAVISNDFARLVIKLIGPTLYSEFVTLYGDKETLIFNLVEYFNTRYEDDEIRKQSLDDITEGNQSEGLNYDRTP